MPLFFLFSLMQANPMTPIWQWGAATGSAIVCTGLFLWSQIQIAILKTGIDHSIEMITESNNTLKAMVARQLEAQEKLADSVAKLAEAVKQQSDTHEEQLALIRDMASEQKILSSNQMTIMNGFQRVVEQLIDAVRA